MKISREDAHPVGILRDSAIAVKATLDTFLPKHLVQVAAGLALPYPIAFCLPYNLGTVIPPST